MTQQRSIFDPNPQEAENDAQRRAAFQNNLAAGRSYWDLIAPADAPPAQPSPFTSVVAGKEIEDPLPAEGAGPFAYKYWIKRAKDANDELRRRLAIERERGDGRTAWAGASREALALAPITGDPERDARIREFLERRDSVLAEGVKAGVGWAAGAASFLTGKEGHRAAAIVKGLANPADKGIQTNPLEATAEELFTEVLPYSLGQSAPAMVTGAAAALGGAAGGGALGLGMAGKAVLGAAGAAAGTHPFSRQEAIGAFADQEERAPASTREKVAVESGAVLGSALDAGSSAVPVLRVFGRIPFQRIQQLLGRGAREQAVKEAQKAVGVQGRRVLLEAAKNIGTEGLTEAIGEAARTSGVAVAREEGITGEDVEGVVAEGIIGGLLGVPMAAAAAARGPIQGEQAAPQPMPPGPPPVDVEGEVLAGEAAPDAPPPPTPSPETQEAAEQLREGLGQGAAPAEPVGMDARLTRWEEAVESGDFKELTDLVQAIEEMPLARMTPTTRARATNILERAKAALQGPSDQQAAAPTPQQPGKLPPPPEGQEAAPTPQQPGQLPPPPAAPEGQGETEEDTGPREPDLTTAGQEGGSIKLAEQNLETWRKAMTDGDAYDQAVSLEEIDTLRMEELPSTLRAQVQGIHRSLKSTVERQDRVLNLEDNIANWMELAKTGDRKAMAAALVEIRETDLKALAGGNPLEANDLTRRVRKAELALGNAIVEKVKADQEASRQTFQDRYDDWKRAAASTDSGEINDTLAAMEEIHPESLTGTQRPKYLSLRETLERKKGKIEERGKRMPDPDPETLDVPEGEDREMLAGTFNDGKPVTVRYAVVEADELRASDAAEGYDRGLQPRSKMGEVVNEIAQNPRWLEVSESGTAQQGAPVVAPGVTGGKRDVEVGNHRAAGLQRAYSGGTAADYRRNLEEAYPDAKGMKRPVLVRVRTERLSPQQRRDFVNAANQSLTQEVKTADRSRDLAPIAREWLKRLASSLFAQDGALPGAYGQRGRDLADKQQEGTDSVPLTQELASRFSPAERASLWEPGKGRPIPTGKLLSQVLNALVHAAYGNEVLTANLSEARPGNKTIQTALQDAAPGVVWLDELAESDYVPASYSIGEMLGRVAAEMFGQSGGAKAAVFTQSLMSSGANKELLRAVADILLAPKWKADGKGGWTRMDTGEELRRRLRGPVQMADTIEAVVKALGEHADRQRAREKAGVSPLLGGPRKPIEKAPPVIEVIQKVLRERDDADKAAPKDKDADSDSDDDSDAAGEPDPPAPPPPKPKATAAPPSDRERAVKALRAVLDGAVVPPRGDRPRVTWGEKIGSLEMRTDAGLLDLGEIKTIESDYNWIPPRDAAPGLPDGIPMGTLVNRDNLATIEDWLDEIRDGPVDAAPRGPAAPMSLEPETEEKPLRLDFNEPKEKFLKRIRIFMEAVRWEEPLARDAWERAKATWKESLPETTSILSDADVAKLVDAEWDSYWKSQLWGGLNTLLEEGGRLEADAIAGVSKQALGEELLRLHRLAGNHPTLPALIAKGEYLGPQFKSLLLERDARVRSLLAQEARALGVPEGRRKQLRSRYRTRFTAEEVEVLQEWLHRKLNAYTRQSGHAPVRLRRTGRGLWGYMRLLGHVALNVESTPMTMSGTLDHEVIHLLRGLGVIRDSEWEQALDWLTNEDLDYVIGIQGYSRLGFSAILEEAVAIAHNNYRADPKLREARPNALFDALERGELRDRKPDWRMRMGLRILHFFEWLRTQLRAAPKLVQGLAKRTHLWFDQQFATSRHYRQPGSAHRRWRQHQESGGARTGFSSATEPRDPKSERRKAAREAQEIREVTTPDNHSREGKPIRGRVRLLLRLRDGLLEIPVALRKGQRDLIHPRRDIAIAATSLPKPNSKGWTRLSGDVASEVPGVARTEVEWRDGKWRRAGTDLAAPKFTHVRAAWDARQRRWRLWVHRAPADAQEAVAEAVANPDVSVDELAADPSVQEAMKERVKNAADAARGNQKEGAAEPPDLEVTNSAATQREEENRWRIWAGQWVLPPLALDWSLPDAKESIHLMRRAMNEAQSARSELRRVVLEDYLKPYENLSEADQLALNKFLFQQDLYNEWPDAAARRKALQELGVQDLKQVEKLAAAARRILFEDVGGVLREQQRYMRAMWRRRIRAVMAEIGGTAKDQTALADFWRLRERVRLQQAAHRRQEIQREADAHRAGAKFEPAPFDPKLTEAQRKLWGRARNILARWAGRDPMRNEKAADFWDGTGQTALVDVTEFRRAYMPRRWYGQFQLVRFDAENNPTILGGGPGKASGFNNEEEAEAAMSEDWRKLSEEEREGARYVLVPRRGPKDDRVMPLDARPGQAFALDQELYRAVGRGGKAALDQLVKDAGMFDIKLPAGALKRARGAATRGIERRRIFRQEIRNALLGSTQRRTGSEGWSWDSGQVLMDHAMDVAYHIHRDRVMFHGIAVLHGAGVTHGLHGGSDPRDTHETRAYRALVRDALGVPGLLQQQLDRLDRAYPFLRWTSERRANVDLILKSILYRMLLPGLPATLWLEAGLWPLAIAAAHGGVMGAVATQLGRGSRSERVAAGDALLQGWVKLGPIMTHLAFALQNITLPLLTGPILTGYRNTFRGLWDKHADWALNPKRKREIREALRRQNIEGQALAHLELLASDKAMSRRVLRFLRLMNVFGILTEQYTREASYRAGRHVGTKAGLKTDAAIEAEAESLSPAGRENLLLTRYDPSESADAFAERSGFAQSVDYGPTGRPRLHRIHAPPVHGRFKFRTFHSNILYLLYLAPFGKTPMMGQQFRGGKRTLRNRAATTMSAGAQMVLLAGIYQGYVGMMIAAYHLLYQLLSGGDDEDEGRGWGTPMADARIEMERKSIERRETGGVGGSLLDQGVFSLLNTSMSNSLGVLPVTTAFSVKDIDLREILAGASIQSELAVAESMASSRTLGEGLRQSIGRVSPGMGRFYEGWRLPPPLVPRENDDVRTSTGRVLYDHGTLAERLQMRAGLTPTYQATLQDKQNFDRLLKAHKERFSTEFQRLLERALLTDDRELLGRIVRARTLYGVGEGNILQEFQQPAAQQVLATAKRLKITRTARQRLWRGLPDADLGIPIWKRLLEEEMGDRPGR